MILLDTDHFSVVTDSRDALHAPPIARLNSANDSLALPIVSVEEQLRGWLKLVHSGTNVAKQVFPYHRLARLIETLAQWELARFGEPAAEEFTSLRRQRIRIGTQDLKIARPSRRSTTRCCCRRTSSIFKKCRGYELRIGCTRSRSPFFRHMRPEGFAFEAFTPNGPNCGPILA